MARGQRRPTAASSSTGSRQRSPTRIWRRSSGCCRRPCAPDFRRARRSAASCSFHLASPPGRTAPNDHRSHRRCDPHAPRAAQRQAQGLAPRRPRGRDAQRADRAHRDRPGHRRRRRHGLRHAGRRAGGQRRAQRRARRRVARRRARHDDRPAVRLQPAGCALRRPGRDRRGVRRGRRRRRRGDDPRADGFGDGRRQVRLPVRPADRRALRARRWAGAAGHLRRADRRQVGHHPRGDGPLRRPLAAVRPAGHRRGPLPERRSSRCSAPTGRW